MRRAPTIIDVARRAGVSKSTVSRVITDSGAPVSEAARDRVHAAIQELGYQHNAIASSLRTDRTNMIMLAIPDITNPFWPDVARGVQDALDGRGYAVVFANSDWDGQREKGFLQMARRNRFDGILINPVQITQAELLATGIPTVLFGSRDDFPEFDTVGSDSYGAAILALTHLLSLSHHRIGLILGQTVRRLAHSRKAGYLDFVRENGLAHEPGLMVEVPYTLAGGREGMQQLLSLTEPPTAVLAANDVLAIGALQAAREAGRVVPADLSIVGLDDIFAASTTVPPLTTVAKPKYEIGQKATALLLERIQSQTSLLPRKCIFPVELRERSSTAPRPA